MTTNAKPTNYSTFNATRGLFKYGRLINNTTYNFKKVIVNNQDDGEIAIQTPEMEVNFVKQETKDDGKTTFQFSLICDREDEECRVFSRKMGEELQAVLVADAAENSEKWYGKELDEDTIIDQYYKPLIYEPEEYDPSINFNVQDYEVDRIHFVDVDGTTISCPNLAEKIKDGYRVEVIFAIPHLTMKGKGLRPAAKVRSIRVKKLGVPRLRVREVDTYTPGDLKIGAREEKKDKDGKKTGGKFCKPTAGGKSMSYILRNVQLAPFPFGQTNTKAADPTKMEYGISVKLDNPEHVAFFENVYEDLKNELFANAEEMYGKKKSKANKKEGDKKKSGNGYTLEEIEDRLKKIVIYGKAEGFAPTIRLKCANFEGSFSTKARDINGDPIKMGLEDFLSHGNQDMRCDGSASYDVSFYLKHVWFADNTTTRFDCSNIQAVSTSTRGKSYTFGDEAVQETTSAGPASETTSAPPNTPENPENSDENESEVDESEDEDSEVVEDSD